MKPYELVIKKLEAFKEKAPELRLGQILWNALAQDSRLEAPEGNALFFIPDIELENLLAEHFKLLERDEK